METILFAPETINLAETTRMIETAKAVRARGANCLFIAYSEKFSGLIEAAGFKLIFLQPKTTEKMAENMLRFDQFKTMKNPFSKELMAQRVANEIDFIKQHKVAKVVTGTSMSIFLSARICQVPLFYIKPFAYSRPQIEAGNMFEGALLNRGLKAIASRLTYIPKMFRQVEKKYGVTVFKKTLELSDGDFNLITTIPALTGVAQLPADYQYIGFMYAKLPGELPEEIHRLKKQSTPLVYFSMGSSSNRKLVEKFLAVLAKLPYTFICPVAYYVPEFKNKKYAENIYIYDWLPTEQVNALIDFSIIHGGEGTVQTACMSGKPFIGLGLQMEQRYNLRLCETYGNAIQIRKRDISVPGLSEKCERLLQDSQMIDCAKQLKEQILTREPSTEHAARIICSASSEVDKWMNEKM